VFEVVEALEGFHVAVDGTFGEIEFVGDFRETQAVIVVH